MIRLFLGIFTRLKRFLKKYFTCVSIPEQWLTGQVGRPHGSTAPEAGRPLRSTDVHKLVHVWQIQGRSAGRPTGPESFALCIWAVDRDCPTVIFMTVGGPPGRSTASLSGCQISLTASFLFGLYKPHFFGILAKIF